jgi:hypothetical protein
VKTKVRFGLLNKVMKELNNVYDKSTLQGDLL